MATTAQGHFVMGGGSFPLHFGAKLIARAMREGFDTFLGAALVDFNRNEMMSERIVNLRNELGDRFKAPPAHLIAQIEGFGGDAEKSMTPEERRTWATHLSTMAEYLVTEALRQGNESPFGFCLFGPPSGGHYLISREYLQRLAAVGLAGMRLGITTLPEDHDKRLELSKAPEFVDELKEAGKLTNVLIMDNLGPIALQYGLQFQDDLMLAGLVGLIGGSHWINSQSSIGDVVRRLSEYGKYICCSFGTHFLAPMPVQAPPVPERGFLAKLFGGALPPPPPPPAPTFRESNIIRQAVNAVNDALTNVHMRVLANNEELPDDAPIYVVLSIPLPHRTAEEWAIWGRVGAAIRYPFLGPEGTKRNVTFILAPNNGAGVVESRATYNVQATAFWATNQIPPLEDAVRTDLSLRRPGLYPAALSRAS